MSTARHCPQRPSITISILELASKFLSTATLMSTMKLFTQALRIIDFVVIVGTRCHICLITPASCLLKIIRAIRALNLTLVIIIINFTVVSSEASRFLTVNGLFKLRKITILL